MLQILVNGKSQFERFKMRKDLRGCIQHYRSLDWEAILKCLRTQQLNGSEIIFGRCIQFLKMRVEYLNDIFSQNLGIAQQELALDVIDEHKGTKES